MVTQNWEETLNIELFLEQGRIWKIHLTSQLLTPAPERWAPKATNFESRGDFLSETVVKNSSCKAEDHGFNPWSEN